MIAVPAIAFSLGDLLSRWIRIGSVLIVPVTLGATFIGNAAVAGGGEWATNIILFGAISLILIAIALGVERTPAWGR